MKLLVGCRAVLYSLFGLVPDKRRDPCSMHLIRRRLPTLVKMFCWTCLLGETVLYAKTVLGFVELNVAPVWSHHVSCSEVYWKISRDLVAYDRFEY